ncbi:MAG: Glycosyltransferase [uncultured Actinomycetospora sp.]|uniref:Glycosyltransferase n=1 Tax=uncultured Actinomycetospora sp. TaxID=1135996 RepID=A0A6J4I7F8_9PSEU|nr:MAG: Glycosyltransferase [uncultured Actinomycetospora sp.]
MTFPPTRTPTPGTARGPARTVLHWHVHGSWSTAFVQGRHTCLLPVLPEGGPWGGGRPAAWDWPARAEEATPEQLRERADEIDVVVLQRPEEIELTERWTGRRPGRDVPALFVEHNTPKGDVPNARHPLADRDDIPVVHVTHFNALMWDTGRAPVRVVEHGVLDPGERYTGELDRAAVVVNEPVRRGRVTGTDLLAGFADHVGLDVYGIGSERLGEAVTHPGIAIGGDLPQDRLHTEMARHRVYLHPVRWTSLGLSLIEAMMLGMPVVALATTEAAVDVPADAGVVATDLDVLRDGLRSYRDDPELARAAGAAGRASALARHGVDRFLADWDDLLDEAVLGAAVDEDAAAGSARSPGRLEPAV